MNWPEIWGFVWKAIVTVGGVSVVAAAVAKFFADRSIEKHKSVLGQETERLKSELAKETESHKLRLKKQEILFQKEIEAATAFLVLRRFVEPKYRHPNMDWDEALEDAVENFTDTEARLGKCRAEHGAVISDANRAELDECITLASNNKFAPHGHTDMHEAKKAAVELLKKLKEIEERFVRELRG